MTTERAPPTASHQAEAPPVAVAEGTGHPRRRRVIEALVGVELRAFGQE